MARPKTGSEVPPIVPTMAIDPDASQVARHLERANNAVLGHWDRMQSQLWLIQNGQLSAVDFPEPQVRGPGSVTALASQGNPRPGRARGPGEPDNRPREAVVVKVSTVARQDYEWLWTNRFALGKLAMVSGDPGVGKSWFTVALAAMISTGARFPDQEGEALAPNVPGNVLMLSAEDAVADTIRPRLEAAGADLSRVFALTSIRRGDGTLAPFSIRFDLPALEVAIAAIGGVRLVVIDPVSSYLGGADEHKNAEVRESIDPLAQFAERHRVAMVLVNHLNKGSGVKAIYRSTGSLAFIAAARTAWYVDRDPEDKARRRMLSAKANITQDPTGLAYRIIDGAIQWEPEPLRMTADDALEQERFRTGREGEDGQRGPVAAKRKAAKAWLAERLAGGAVPSPTILAEGQRKGFSRTTLNGALNKLGVERIEVDGLRWLQLPADLGLDGDAAATPILSTLRSRGAATTPGENGVGGHHGG